MVREALDLKDDHGRLAGPDRRHDRTERGVAGQRVAAVQPVDGHPVKFGRLAVGPMVERVAAGAGGDPVAVVLDPKEHRKLCPDGLGDSLKEFALLARAVAHGADDQGCGAVAGIADAIGDHLVGDADGLERVVADRADEAEHLELGRAQMGAHLAAGGMGTGGADRTMEELLGRNAAGQHQRLVAVMQVQPVVGRQVRVQRRAGLVARATDVEERLAPVDEFHLDLVHEPRREHRPVEGEGAREVIAGHGSPGVRGDAGKAVAGHCGGIHR